MAEIAHTCINTSPWDRSPPPCPGCQAQNEKLFAKERELLDAAVAFADSDQGRDDGTLLRVAREYAALKRQTLGR